MGQWAKPLSNNNKDSRNLIPYTKINFRWIKDLHFCKLLHSYFEIGSSERGTRDKNHKEKTDMFDYTNVKCLCGNLRYKQGGGK